MQVVREWLPHAEAELKFRTISEDEEGILQLIENHDVSFILGLLYSFLKRAVLDEILLVMIHTGN